MAMWSVIDGVPLNWDKITGVGAVVAVAILVITDRLVWHTRLKKAEADRDRWEGIALDLMKISHVGVRAAEVSSEVLGRLPNHTQDEDRV